MRILRAGPEERGVAAVVAVVFFGIQTTHGLSSNAADALFFSRFGVESLPQMYMVVGIVALVALLGYTAGLGRLERHHFYPAMLASTAAILIGLRVLVILNDRWVYAVIWISVTTTVLLTLTLMWNLAADVADARAARRLYPVFASAGILGGIFGNVLTGPLANTIGVENILLVAGGILAMMAVGVRHEACRRRIMNSEDGPRPVGDLTAAYRTAIRSPLLRLVGLTMILAAVLFGGVVFHFSTAVAERFTSESDIATFLGWFSAAATATTFLFSLLVSNRIFARFGIVVAIFVVAAIYVSGFALWLVVFGLLTAAVVRFLQWVVTVAIGGPATTALFNVYRGELRAPVMALMFAVPANVGVVLSGMFLWSGERWLTRPAEFVILMLIALAFAMSAWLLRARYREALMGALSEGSFENLDAPQPGLQKLRGDADVIRAGVVGLTDPQPGTRRLAAEMLGRLESVAAVDALFRQLADPEVAVRLAVVEALGRIGATGEPAQLLARLSDTEPVVRAATVDVLTALAPDSDIARTVQDQDPVVRSRIAVLVAKRGDIDASSRIVSELVGADSAESRIAGLHAIADIGLVPENLTLDDIIADAKEPGVRAAAMEAGRIDTPDPAVILEALGDQDDRVRSAAVRAARSRGLTTELLDMLNRGSVVQQEAALIALEPNDDVASAVVEWAVPRVADAARLRRLRSDIEAIHGQNMAAAEYLMHLLGEREWQLEQLVVRALTQFHAPGATELIIRGLSSSDLEVRSQALEAIDTIGNKEIAGRLLPLLERHPANPTPDINTALEELSADADPLIRALAIRCIAEVVEHRWRRIVKNAAEDSFPLVRDEAVEALVIVGGDVTNTLRTLSTIDRMLFLRGVELFASLEPEDLQSIAEVATEEVFATGERIYDAGESSDEMLVIVRGLVRLTKQVDGRRQVVGEYGEHQHVGELAVLRSAPRSADVEAASDDVRVLVIGGTQLRHLVADRPQVAQAMLTSLAERLATLIEEGPTGTRITATAAPRS